MEGGRGLRTGGGPHVAAGSSLLWVTISGVGGVVMSWWSESLVGWILIEHLFCICDAGVERGCWDWGVV